MKLLVALIMVAAWGTFFFGTLYILAGMTIIPWAAFWVPLAIGAPLLVLVILNAVKEKNTPTE